MKIKNIIALILSLSFLSGIHFSQTHAQFATLFPEQGGTGTSTIPTTDQILYGLENGTYELRTISGSAVSTSTPGTIVFDQGSSGITSTAQLTSTSTTAGRIMTFTSDGATSSFNFQDTKLNLNLGGGSSDPIEIYDSSWGATAIRTPRAGLVSVGISGFTPELGETGSGFIGAMDAGENTPSYYCYSTGNCYSRSSFSTAGHTWTVIGNQTITTNNTAAQAGIRLDTTGSGDIAAISKSDTELAKWTNGGSYEILQSTSPHFVSNLGGGTDQFVFTASNTLAVVNKWAWVLKDGTTTSTNNVEFGVRTGTPARFVVGRVNSAQSSWMQSNQWCLGDSTNSGTGSTCGVNVSMAADVNFDNTDNARDISFRAGNTATRTTSTVFFRPARQTLANDSSVVFQKLGVSSSTNNAFLQVHVASTPAQYLPSDLFVIGYNTSTVLATGAITSSSAVFWVDKNGGVHTTSTAVSALGAISLATSTITNLSLIGSDATTTPSLGGGLLGAGACALATSSLPGVATSSVVMVTPQIYPGDGSTWFGYVSSTGLVVTKVCAIVAVTPVASPYNVRIIR